MMKQAFKQMIDNALKYSPDSAPVAIAAEASDGWVVVRISDLGPGIAPEEQERIFEKFYRGREGQRSGSGTGMGLAIAKRIIEEHGGTVQIASTPGAGAVFSAALPIHRGEEG